jgi:hypothetical protein
MDSVEYLIKAMEQTGADEIKQEFNVEKDGKEYLFEIKLTRKYSENDTLVD